ncbi:MAG: MTH938/NDUFAF3 family protein, partial [Anaerolineales bacterium]|nr:MTH938/NDUFAF3 family protein [Anaerolineales bacterium]
MTKPKVEGTGFGFIDVDGERISHDILIRLDGEVIKRKKKLSKEIYGTSHKISLAEAEYIYQEGASTLLIGAGQFGRVQLSPEAVGFFQEQNCEVDLRPTPEAVKTWNESEGEVLG